MQMLAAIFKDVPDRLVQLYRQALVKHADETGWRDNWCNGFAWLFCTTDLSIFRFRGTRSGSVAREVFGDAPHTGNPLSVLLQLLTHPEAVAATIMPPSASRG